MKNIRIFITVFQIKDKQSNYSLDPFLESTKIVTKKNVIEQNIRFLFLNDCFLSNRINVFESIYQIDC